MAFHAFVVAMGLGTVFFGLVCIVALIYVTGKVVQRLEKIIPTAAPAQSPAPQAQDDSELAAVITAALAQDLGDEPGNIVIRSITSAN